MSILGGNWGILKGNLGDFGEEFGKNLGDFEGIFRVIFLLLGFLGLFLA